MSGQKLRWAAIDGAGGIVRHDLSANRLWVKFEDGHESTFPLSFLRAYAYDPLPRASPPCSIPSPHLWRGSTEFLSQARRFSFAELLTSDAALLCWARQICALGLALADGAAVDDDEAVARLARRLGPVRETIYGPTWQVRAVENPENVAYTARALPLHQDLLYYEVPPGVQLLHCRVHAASGGRATFADGLRMAEDLRKEDPESFAVLSRVRVGYHRRDARHHLHRRRPIFEVDAEGCLLRVQLSPPFEAPLCADPEDVEPFYAAYAAFSRLWHGERAASYVHAETYRPGVVAAFDNRRLLHARAAFQGERHLTGTYVDHDHLWDTIRTLAPTDG